MRYNTKSKMKFPGDNIDVIAEMQKIGIDKSDCLKKIYECGRSTCLKALLLGIGKTDQEKKNSFSKEITRIKGGCEKDIFRLV